MIDMTTFWVILFVILLIAEAITAGALISIWFCIGSLAALAASAAGASLGVQVVVFFAVSVALLILTKPFLQKVLHQKQEPTNLDRLLGKEAVVTEDICHLKETGAVRVEGKTWTARSSSNIDIPKGDVVRIDRMEGVKLFVSTLKSRGN